MGRFAAGGVRIAPRRPTPVPSPRTTSIIVVLSLLLPGLGHVYVGKFPRALIWFAGSLVIAGILRGGSLEEWIPFAVLGALGAFAALDGWLVIRPDGGSKG